MNRVRLQTPDSLLDLAPKIGGGIARLVLAGHDILRPALDDAADVLQLGEFPMAPWVNRIAGGAFTWNGRSISVADGPSQHTQGLHGVSWRTPWSAERRGDSEIVLSQTWPGGAGWPFPFFLARRFRLKSQCLDIEATLQNAGDAVMPVAMGFHPLFPSAGARLRASVAAGWATDADGIPVSADLHDAAASLSLGIEAGARVLDTCFDGWDGVAVIDWPTHALTLRTDPPLGHLQVYTPEGAAFFCVEPQSAMPNAFNADPAVSGVRMLAPGEAFTCSLRLEVRPRT